MPKETVAESTFHYYSKNGSDNNSVDRRFHRLSVHAPNIKYVLLKSSRTAASQEGSRTVAFDKFTFCPYASSGYVASTPSPTTAGPTTVPPTPQTDVRLPLDACSDESQECGKHIGLCCGNLVCQRKRTRTRKVVRKCAPCRMRGQPCGVRVGTCCESTACQRKRIRSGKKKGEIARRCVPCRKEGKSCGGRRGGKCCTGLKCRRKRSRKTGKVMSKCLE